MIRLFEATLLVVTYLVLVMAPVFGAAGLFAGLEREVEGASPGGSSVAADTTEVAEGRRLFRSVG